MSDDEGSHRGKGKRGKGEGGCRENAGSRAGKGGRGGGGGAGGGSVTRLKVVPKFLQELQERLKPEESKRGLAHAELADKTAALQRDDDDDEYDIEAAQIADCSDFSAETFRKFKKMAKEPRSFFAAEAPRPSQEPGGPMKFRAKEERGSKEAAKTGAAAVTAGRRPTAAAPVDEPRASRAAGAKRQRLSFEDG
mmetsp:Transcript_44650/g.103225  ORF Transcript_44650/g.103225 Transcript_44650/m.103225 type:complete len:194 (-) Transcript_44650:68-649(-)